MNALQKNEELEKLLSYLVGNHRCYPGDADYLETIWFLAGQPADLPPYILSGINVSDAEHRDRLLAQIHHANDLGGDYLHRLTRYVYLIPEREWETCEEPPSQENGIKNPL